MKFLLFSGLLLILACSNGSPLEKKTKSIYPISTYQLDIPEPSGVCFGNNYETLWIVSDTPHNRVYQTDFEGRLLHTLDFKGDDLEGIAYDHKNDVIWLAEEQLQEIVKISTDGKELDRFAVPLQKTGKNGLEGVTMAEPSGFWVVNEKNPLALASLDSMSNIIQIYSDALFEDYSDVFYDPVKMVIWIVSDESRLLISWSPEAGVIERYSLPFNKAEGIAVYPETEQIFIVNDGESTLSIFDLRGNK